MHFTFVKEMHSITLLIPLLKDSSFEGDNSHYLEPNFVNKTLSRSEMVSMQPGDHKWEIMFGITKLPFVCESGK